MRDFGRRAPWLRYHPMTDGSTAVAPTGKMGDAVGVAADKHLTEGPEPSELVFASISALYTTSVVVVSPETLISKLPAISDWLHVPIAFPI